MRRLLRIAICFPLLASLLAGPCMASSLIWTEMMKSGWEAHDTGDFVKAEKLLLAALKEANAERSDGQKELTMLWLGRTSQKESLSSVPVLAKNSRSSLHFLQSFQPLIITKPALRRVTISREKKRCL